MLMNAVSGGPKKMKFNLWRVRAKAVWKL